MEQPKGANDAATPAPPCPAWCTTQHPRADYLNHAREVLTVDTGDLTVAVTLAEHAQPGYSEAPRVRIFTDTADESGVLDLYADQAATLGRVLVTLEEPERRQFADALVDAAARLLTGGAS